MSLMILVKSHHAVHLSARDWEIYITSYLLVSVKS